MAAPRTWLAVAVFTAAALTACDSEPRRTGQSTRDPAPSSAVSSTATDQPETAPRVRNPLAGDAFAAAPCTGLTAPQLAGLRLSGGQADAATASCTYAAVDPDLEVRVLFPGFARGLDELYARRGVDTDDWTAVEIDGYPAVHFRPRKAADVCDLAVGLNDRMYFYIRVVAPVDSGTDTCARATTVGAAVLATVKAAN